MDETLIARETVSAAYAQRAHEYAALFGSRSALAPQDLDFVSSWARNLRGTIIDVGCGPGQWTHTLAELGMAAEGIDPVPEFVTIARQAFPRERFSLGHAEQIETGDATYGGVLAWYSLIHIEPAHLCDALTEFHRVLQPGGSLALGFFEGPRLERFAHAVAPAWFWPLDRMIAVVEAAGFSVTQSEVRSDPGTRRHGALTATRIERDPAN